MRLASLKTDFWQLRSGVLSNREYPDTFWIPSQTQRESIAVGNAVKVIIDIETIDEDDGSVVTTGERVWLIVSEVTDGGYIGILDNQPGCLEPDSGFYLKFGSEVPFLAEHIVDISQPPEEYVDWQLSQPPENIWPR